jgi:curved DNA-binding protein
METKDYYKILGIDKKASADDIKKAYRKFARKYHPDVNPNDKTAENKFKELQEAYDILKDEKKRKEYDDLGSNYFKFKNGGGGSVYQGQNQYYYSGNMGGGQQNYNFNAGGGEFNFEDVFSDLFNRSAKQKGPQTGQDIQAKLNISVQESVSGSEKIIDFNNEKIKVKIPAGIANGGKIRIQGKGSAGINGGKNGDLYIEIGVMSDNIFERKGNDIYVTKKIKLTEAVLGAKVEVPTIDGKIMLTIPPGTQNGSKFRIPKKGAPDIKGKIYGDEIVNIFVELPSNISANAKKYFSELAKEGY